MKHTFPRLVVADLLIALCACVTLCQSPNNQQLAEVPFAFDRTSVVIEAKLNGKGPFNMILDTGNDVATIDLATARALGLNLKATRGHATGGGLDKPQIFLTQISQVEIGRMASKNIYAAAIDLSRQSQILGKPLHGVLGYSFLKNRVVQFDYPKRMIRFYSSSPYQKAERSAPVDQLVMLPFRLVDESPIIDDVYVNGKKIKAVIDTGGAGYYFALMPEAITFLGLEKEMAQGVPDNHSAGVNGLITSRKGKINSLRVGTITVDSPTVTFFPTGTGMDNLKFAGALGNVFLQDYLVTFDYPNKTVVFERP